MQIRQTVDHGKQKRYCILSTQLTFPVLDARIDRRVTLLLRNQRAGSRCAMKLGPRTAVSTANVKQWHANESEGEI